MSLDPEVKSEQLACSSQSSSEALDKNNNDDEMDSRRRREDARMAARGSQVSLADSQSTGIRHLKKKDLFQYRSKLRMCDSAESKEAAAAAVAAAVSAVAVSPQQLFSSSFLNSDLSESRTIYKVRRFLSTLIQFGADISADTGDRVKELVFALVAGTVSVSEFQQLLQELASFPLRPFVLPFLKSNIPLLMRDVASLAILSGQTPLQYLRAHQHLILDLQGAQGQRMEFSEAFQMERSDNAGQKRKANDDNNAEIMANGNKFPRHRDNNVSTRNVRGSEPPQQHRVFPQRHVSSQVSPQSIFSSSTTTTTTMTTMSTSSETTGTPVASEDEWRNIHVMLSCIMGMVDKTKRALAILEQRQLSPQAQASPASPPALARPNNANNGNSITNGTNVSNGNNGNLNCNSTNHIKSNNSGKSNKNCFSGKSTANDVDNRDSSDDNSNNNKNVDINKSNKNNNSDKESKDNTCDISELLSTTLRNTEERVTEARRKADLAVQEAKREAMEELQRALALAEQRATNSASSGRLKTENEESGQKIFKTSQNLKDECWGCGRNPSETCGGFVRYGGDNADKTSRQDQKRD